MRKSMFVSFATLVLGASLALTGCKVGDDGGGGGDNPGDEDGDRPDAGEPQGGEPCPPSVEEFVADVFPVFTGSTCLTCHVAGGVAGSTTLVLAEGADDANFLSVSNTAKKTNPAGVSVLLLRPSGGVSHTGGSPFPQGSEQYGVLEQFVNQVNGTGGVCD